MEQQTKPRKDSPKRRQKKILKLSGPEFLIEITTGPTGTLQQLVTAYDLTHNDLAMILSRSLSFTEKLLRGEVLPSADNLEQIRHHMGLQCLSRQNPKGPPLVELTPRSLTVVRKGRNLTNLALGKITGLNADQLGRFQGGKVGMSREHMQQLGQALQVRFFMT